MIIDVYATQELIHAYKEFGKKLQISRRINNAHTLNWYQAFYYVNFNYALVTNSYLPIPPDIALNNIQTLESINVNVSTSPDKIELNIVSATQPNTFVKVYASYFVSPGSVVVRNVAGISIIELQHLMTVDITADWKAWYIEDLQKGMKIFFKFIVFSGDTGFSSLEQYFTAIIN
jgi:hypothetical protein